MNSKQQLIVKNVDAHRQEILDAERWIWKHPEVGFTEWQTNTYLIEKFEAMGYKLVRADQDPKYGKIPGFYTDIDTGKPGPFLCIMGELDALDIANHPESVNGMTHCCGHHCQASAMLGIALALKEPGALDGLSGKVRLMLVPAEEMIQLAYRGKLIREGVISYMGGKVEFLHRGYFDDIDLALMIHTEVLPEGTDFFGIKGFNGAIPKVITYKGKSSHAGGAPHMGINAQYASMLGLQACNDLRETLQEKDYVRFHPIMRGVSSAVNIIPDEMVIESYVRGANLEAMIRENKKFNRALAGGALAMGACVHLTDKPGYSPELHDPQFSDLCAECCADLVGKERVNFSDFWDTGSSDFGDVTCVMPGIQFYCAGASGTTHGIDFEITDPEKAVMNSAKAQLFIMDALMTNGAEKAKQIVADYKAPFASIEEYFACIDKLIMDKDAVVYDENGNATVDFQNI